MLRHCSCVSLFCYGGKNNFLLRMYILKPWVRGNKMFLPLCFDEMYKKITPKSYNDAAYFLFHSTPNVLTFLTRPVDYFKT